VTNKQQEPEQDNWESEGGAVAPEPTQKTPKGLKIPVPTRKELLDSFRKIVQPVKKP
jgi:hypothetical protein